MARRGKTSPAEDIMDLVAMLPWWGGVVLALVSYLLLHSVASQQVVATAQPGQVGAMVTQTCPQCQIDPHRNPRHKSGRTIDKQVSDSRR